MNLADSRYWVSVKGCDCLVWFFKDANDKFLFMSIDWSVCDISDELSFENAFSKKSIFGGVTGVFEGALT